MHFYVNIFATPVLEWGGGNDLMKVTDKILKLNKKAGSVMNEELDSLETVADYSCPSGDQTSSFSRPGQFLFATCDCATAKFQACSLPLPCAKRQ